MDEKSRSLSEVHNSVDTEKPRSKWRRAAAFFGPAYLVSVGYMDPGNWATDLQAGALFGYKLLWVLVMSNIMALLLQSLSARLGIVRGRDLAQCNREVYPRGLNFVLYILAELAIAACDLAEVIGMAIGLNLLLGLPILWGVVITLLDTFLLLFLQRLGMRKMEAFIITLVVIIGLCFMGEMFLSNPDFEAMARGLIPMLPANPTGPEFAGLQSNMALYLTIGIIGATVMPHNLYLHSALVQTRKIKNTVESIKKALKYNFADSAIALNLALLVNAAILILAAAAFHNSGNATVQNLEDAHELLTPLLGTQWASHFFAIALIAAGQSSTITGTLAGQIVMEGYLRLRISPIARRLLSRMLAIVPAVLVIAILGDEMVTPMLVFSQVLLSMQLGFAVIPLIYFVSNKEKMGVFAIGIKMKLASWLIASVITLLNLKLVYEEVLAGMAHTDSVWLKALLVIGGITLVGLLAMTVIYPLLRNRPVDVNIHSSEAIPVMQSLPTLGIAYSRIALALDFSSKDENVIRHALMFAKPHSIFILIHIVESAPAKLREKDTEDYETRKDREQLEAYATLFHKEHYKVEIQLGFRSRAREIARIVEEEQAELLVVGSHGHHGLRDWLFGETINSLRHKVKVPLFIAR